MTVEQPKTDLLSLLPEALESTLAEHLRERGQPSYRLGQILAWLYERDAMRFEEMTDLPLEEREALARRFEICAPEPARIERSTDGTTKHLWRMADGELIESVLIPTGAREAGRAASGRLRSGAEAQGRRTGAREAGRAASGRLRSGAEAQGRRADDRLTLCLSSQAGCAMACVFCATGWSGYRRQLTAGEIVAQFRGARRWAAQNGLGAITNVVFMGMGEPLMNTKAVLPALTLLNHAYGLGARRITVSTVGVVPGIRALAERPEQFRLAVSLHAPNHELRQEIVPLETKYPLADLLEALRDFEEAGGRRITFEYIMIDGMTDAPELAEQLARLIAPFQSHVNLIPYNPIPGPDWRPSPRPRMERFAALLEEQGVPATIREPRGLDIAAACGQLRAEHETSPPRPFLQLTQRRRDTAGRAG